MYFFVSTKLNKILRFFCQRFALDLFVRKQKLSMRFKVTFIFKVFQQFDTLTLKRQTTS